MALHDSLQELVRLRGPAVVGDAEEFRGALDDFLAEDEASIGEVNLLVDAVRLGAVQRLLSVIEHGAEPVAAIEEAGAALARDRGTDDPRRSCWALSVLGYALGRIDRGVVDVYAAARQSSADSFGGGELRTPTTPVPADASEARTVPETPVPAAAPPAADPPVPAAPVPVAAAQDGRGGVRRVSLLLVVVLVLVVAAVAGAGAALLVGGRGDDTADAGDDDDPSTSAAQDPSEDRTKRAGKDPKVATVPEEHLLNYYSDGVGSRIYEVDPVTGEATALTDGPEHRLATISPDRSVVTYIDAPSSGPFVPYVLDLETGEGERLFADDGPCAYANRPAWSPDGTRLAVVCTDAEGTPTGIYLADPDGTGIELLLGETALKGAPTWTSDSSLVFTKFGAAETDPSTLYSIDIDDPTPVALTGDWTGFVANPDWSPEAGRLLITVSDDPEDADYGALWSVDVDGAGGPVLDGPVAAPVWSPDGSQAAVLVRDSAGDAALATVDLSAGASEPVLVPNPPGTSGAPVWGSR